MRLKQLTCLLLLIHIATNAQTTTTYYDQYGMPIGTAKTERTWTQQPYQGSTFQYQSTLPSLELIERGLAYKQGQTDSRKASIQTMIESIAAEINRLFVDHPDEGRRLYKDLSDLVLRLNNIQQDITQDQVYNPMIDMVNDFKGKVYRTYKGLTSVPRTTSGKALPKWADIKTLLDDRKYSEAIEALSTLANAVSDNEPYIEYRAWIYGYRIRNFEKAIQDYTTCIQMRPDSPKLYYQRGGILKQMKLYPEAVKDYTSGLQYDPNNLDACFARALCKVALGDYQGEGDDYDVIISKLEENNQLPHRFLMATIYNNKGYGLFKRGRSDEALFWVTRALKEGGTYESYIWSSRGEIYLKQGKYKEAISDFDKSIELFEAKKSQALSLSENDGFEYFLRGLAKIKVGAKEAGCRDLSKAGEQGYADAYKSIGEQCK